MVCMRKGKEIKVRATETRHREKGNDEYQMTMETTIIADGNTTTTSLEDVPLPENIQLLTNRELLGLLTEHADKLSEYVTKFHPLNDTISDIQTLKQRLRDLHERFDELQLKRDDIKKELEDYKVVESMYVKKWQDFHHLIQEKYSDDALRRNVEMYLKRLDNECTNLEVSMYDTQGQDGMKNIDMNQLNLFVKEYLEKRQKFHLNQEKLNTWNEQGSLRL
ncbi:ESCRT-I subunit protein SRN2 NDAI_0G02640 [Naumovozyma dairenensis CBS 421]|uniref:VPS37 C-terminal domain-containing protein n=1 Tax=Naumovozyma dairenensis (strain ATCC 10597 / BCRC 20456 / CBS 421 / NBRC 0211 / NRRL Y-12639) TaxID=1071378 RepID=G0WE30_NAUDC|nr:hypothetical protein NDAI_0G02640 [Naumovozyma dairenensis CBS 421]CCD26041.2 hypothetical protein NDAI_0G02640 [Naumovozyma dairenensis CBS 421]